MKELSAAMPESVVSPIVCSFPKLQVALFSWYYPSFFLRKTQNSLSVNFRNFNPKYWGIFNVQFLRVGKHRYQ